MTIEEAIKELIDASHREAKYGDTNNHYYEIMMRIEAFDMAIKALETQPCEDCISRADILDAIETWDKFGVNAEQKLIRWQDHYVPYVHLDDVRNAIANMPSVTPSIPDVENNYDIGYNCGYADAMIDIAEGSESE
jgi:hypothetical protein